MEPADLQCLRLAEPPRPLRLLRVLLLDRGGHGSSYSTFYIRRAFGLAADDLAELQSGASSLALLVSYDDGFVAYLNGAEVGRENFGTPGTPMAYNAFADNRGDQLAITYHLDATGLTATGNVLAIQARTERGAATSSSRRSWSSCRRR